MRFVVLYSSKDIAGKNIAEQLKTLYVPQIPIVELTKESIFSENIDKDKRISGFDFLVFVSKHKSRQARKTFSLHAPGNWRNADFGGKTGKVCPTSGLVLKYLYQKMIENIKKENSDYESTLEVTHHGPYVEKPCCFIEIGSGETEWNDEKAARVIAKTVAELQKFEKKLDGYKVAVGIGGPHYSPNFNKLQEKSEYAIGHIIPEYALPLTQAMLKEALEKTQENVNCILLDWKGLGKSEDREEIIKLLKHLDLKFLRTNQIEK